MAQGTAPSVQQAGGVAERLARAEQLIDQRLEETRKRVKSTDFAVALFLLALGICAYLFAAAVVDHWAMPLALGLDELLLPEGTRGLSGLLPALGLFEQPPPLGSGGLSAGGRLAMWMVLVVAVAWVVVRRLLPLVLFRINPVFAAYTIEQSRPSLKNSLINLLFLRREKDEFLQDDLARRVFEGLEYRTAGELAQVSPDTAVDRSRLIRLGYALIVMVAVLCLYLIFSPKNPIVSMRRVMWPWAGLQAPTRVTIRHVDPGDVAAYQGDTLIVSAEVRGLRAGETPTLYFTTADRQTVDEAIPMAPAGPHRFQCELPPGKLGLSQSLEYFISAGDATTRTYAVEVQVPLSIVVERVEYQYPAYTGKARETVEGTGDIKALEGTEATVYARANQPIDKATIEFDGDSRSARRMEARGQSAQVAFFLRMNPQEPTQPEYTSYQLRFSDPQGREDRRPIRYRIEVLPDLPPEVRILGELPDEIRLPRNGRLDVLLRAEDPDFGLRKVGIRAQCQDKTLPVPPLLDLPRYEKAHRGPLEGTCRIEPARLGLKVGDKVVFWAEAEDNRELITGPAPNRAETEKRLILIVPDEVPKNVPARPPAGGQKPDKRSGSPDKSQQPGEPPQPSDQPQVPEQPGNQDRQNPSAKQPGAKPSERSQDGEDSAGRNSQPPDAETKPARPNQDAGGDEASEQAEPGNQGQPKGKPGAEPGGAEEPSGAKEQQPGRRSGGQEDMSPSGQQPAGAPSEPSPAGQPSGAEQQPAGSQPARQPVNSRTNPGDAIEEILRHHQQQQSRQPGESAGQDMQAGGAKPESQRSASPKASPAGQGPPPEDQGRAEPQPSTEKPDRLSEAKPATSPGKPQRAGDKPQPSAIQKPGQGDSEDSDRSGQPDVSAKPPDGQEKPGGAIAPKPAEMSKAPTKPERAHGGDQEKGKSPGTKPSELGEDPGQRPKFAAPEEQAAGEKPAGEKPAAASPSATAEKPSSMQKPEGGEKPAASSQLSPSEEPEMPEGQEQPAASSPTKEPGATSKPGSLDSKPPEKSPAAKEPAKPQAHPPGCTCEQCRGGWGQAGQSPQAPPPMPQEANQPRADQPKPAASPAAEKTPSSETPQSPSTSAKQSKSEGQEGGDRSGGGKQGGGQAAEDKGPGMAGSQTDAQQGSDASMQPGQGPTGTKPGQQAPSDQAAGKPSEEAPPSSAEPSDQGAGKLGAKSSAESAAKPPDAQSQGSSQTKEPSGTPGAQGGASGTPAPTPGGTPGGKTGGGAQNPQGGGLPGKGEPPPPAEPVKPQADDPILEYTLQQTNLALRHLEEEANKGRSDLLERLGWTPEQAREFIEWYRKLEQAARQPGPEGQAARHERDAWLKSLGLRPRGTELRGGTTPADKLQNLKDAGRIPPPPKWRTQFRAFTEGLGSQQP